METPPTPQPTASRLPSGVPWPMVAFLVLAIAGAGTATVIQWRAHEKKAEAINAAALPPANAASRNASGIAPEPGTLQMEGMIERLGSSSEVIVYGRVAHCETHTQTCEALREFMAEHEDDVQVLLWPMEHPSSSEAIGSSCAGYSVCVRNADGQLARTALFEKSPAAGGWQPEQLIEKIAEAVATVDAPDAEDDSETEADAGDADAEESDDTVEA